MFVIRARFSKTGECAYISHLDLQRVMGRALKQSRIPVWYSKGFNPHIYMTFALPLTLSHSSLCEAVDFKSEQPPQKVWIDAVNACLPSGIAMHDMYIAQNKPSDIGGAKYQLTHDDAAVMSRLCDEYNTLATAKVIKKTKRSEKEIDLKQFLPQMHCEDGTVTAILPAGDMTVSPSVLMDFLSTLNITDTDAIAVTRMEVLDKKCEIWG